MANALKTSASFPQKLNNSCSYNKNMALIYMETNRDLSVLKHPHKTQHRTNYAIKEPARLFRKKKTQFAGGGILLCDII
jgi:hypothetical protein